MSKRIPATVGAAVLALGVAGLAPGSAGAATDNFFKGKTITVVVPSGSGGTYHVYCQIVQRNIARFIPGNPKTTIQNRSGAGGVRAANYMVNVAPKDGTVIAMINPGSAMVPLLRKGQKAIRFDTRTMNWLGAASVRTYTIAFWHKAPGDKSPIRSIEDLRKRQAIMVTTGKAATSYLIPSFMNKTMGTRMKIITGYKGGGALNLALERGEGEGRGNYYSGFTGVRPGWIKDGKVKLVAWMGPPRPEIKGIPNIRDFMKTDLQKEMYDLLDVSFQVGQAFYVPPGTPKARVNVLRKAFMAMVNDPATRESAKKRRVPMNVRTAAQIEAAIKKGYGASPVAVATLAKMLGYDKARKKRKKKK